MRSGERQTDRWNEEKRQKQQFCLTLDVHNEYSFLFSSFFGFAVPIAHQFRDSLQNKRNVHTVLKLNRSPNVWKEEDKTFTSFIIYIK